MAVKPFLFAALLLFTVQQLPPRKPGFKANVTVIEVDVVVTDTSGRPVRGLGKDDFEIAEDGAPVEIASFSTVDLPEAPLQISVASPERPVSTRDRKHAGRHHHHPRNAVFCSGSTVN